MRALTPPRPGESAARRPAAPRPSEEPPSLSLPRSLPRSLATAAATFGFAAAGVAAFFPVQALERLAGLGLWFNVCLEEGAKLAFAAAAALFAGRRPERARLVLFGAVAAIAFGTVENLSYLFAFADTRVFARLAYSFPLHVNTTLAYCLALSARNRFRAVPVAAFACVVGHAALNLLALGDPRAPVLAAVSVLHALVFAAAYAACYRRFAIGGTRYGRTYA